MVRSTKHAREVRGTKIVKSKNIKDEDRRRQGAKIFPLVVVVGGGTGTNAVLRGMVERDVRLAAVVAMSDNGGSTGMLRSELGALPPGDVRQCMIALAGNRELAEIMHFRFSKGKLAGHNLGNLMIAACEESNGDFNQALRQMGELLKLRGEVVPVTLNNVTLVVRLDGGEIVGQTAVNKHSVTGPFTVCLEPCPSPNPRALEILNEAGAIVIGPGDFFSSIVPNLVVPGIAEAIKKSKARKIYVCNLMTKPGHTDNWSVTDFVNRIESYIGTSVDNVIYNTNAPRWEDLGWQPQGGEKFVEMRGRLPSSRFIGREFVAKKLKELQPVDFVVRNPVLHDADLLGETIMGLVSDY